MPEVESHFGLTDYSVLSVMLIVCTGIGIYHGTKRKKGHAEEYIMAGRKISFFPISMSLAAGHVSAITVIGAPTDSYFYGCAFAFYSLAMSMMLVFSCYNIFPVFHNLQLTSVYEYLHIRYDKRMRFLGSFLFLLRQVSYAPLMIYLTVVSFSQVSGTPIYPALTVITVTCVFYTFWGGFRGVVWTDVVQVYFMLFGIAAACIKAVIEVGGFSRVWDLGVEGDRIAFPSTSWDITQRDTLWSIIFGASLHQFHIAVLEQSAMQRFLALKSQREVIRASIIFGLCVIVLQWGSVFIGVVMYAYFHNCDPMKSGLVGTQDQLVPLFIAETLSNVPGLCGLFMAGVVSATMSTISTSLNSTSCVILEDFVRPNRRKALTEKSAQIILFSTILFIGAFYFVLAMGTGYFSMILELGMQLQSITSAASVGVFLGALFFPWINPIGAFYGGIAGILFNVIMVIGSRRAQAIGAIRKVQKATSVESCNNSTLTMILTTNVTSEFTISGETPTAFILFRTSFLWHTLFGALLTIFVSLIISWMTKFNEREMEAKLFAPIVRRWIERRRKKTEVPEEFHLMQMNNCH